MRIKKQDFNFILGELADLVEFAERQRDEGLVDGSCDPELNIVRATSILNEHRPGWREQDYARPA